MYDVQDTSKMHRIDCQILIYSLSLLHEGITPGSDLSLTSETSSVVQGPTKYMKTNYSSSCSGCA